MIVGKKFEILLNYQSADFPLAGSAIMGKYSFNKYQFVFVI